MAGAASQGRVPLGSYAGRLAAGEPVARLRDVSYSFDGGATWALEHVDLEVGARERLCLMGANGSGKSTLAMVLAGLRAPDAGRVELAGELCFDEGRLDACAYRRARRHTGLVFQDPDDQIVATIVADDVAFGPENLRLAPSAIGRRVERELDRVHALDLASADPSKLSGGQVQRVAIAGAMAMEPALMIFDEATAFLDVRGRGALRRIARRLDEVCAQVWVSHSAADARGASRLVVLARGRVAFDGEPSELLGDAPRMEALGLEPPFFAELAGELRSRGWEFPPVASEEELAQAVAARVGRGVEERPEERPEASAAALGEPVFSARDLAFSYEDKPVLQGIDLDVRAGELVALVGSTGSGKTTLARLLAALAAPSAGRLHALGLDLASRRGRRDLAGRVGFLMQRPERQLFAPTVAEDVAFGPRNLGLPEDRVRARVEAALERLCIAHLAERSPFELSGGQQRLAALAGVLSMQPEAWILDEPLAGLDAASRARVTALIRELRGEGKAVVVVTHAMDQAATADRIVVLGRGRARLQGPPAEVFSHAEELRREGLGLPHALGFSRRLAELGAPVGSPLTLPSLVRALVEAGRP